MYLIVIGWMYVVLMMSVAEGTASNGTVLGALVTFFLYGVGPVALVVYLMGSPGRSKALKKREADARAQHAALVRQETSPADPAGASVAPDAGGHAAGGAEPVSGNPGVAPVRKE
jgi:hypothetical protein